MELRIKSYRCSLCNGFFENKIGYKCDICLRHLCIGCVNKTDDLQDFCDECN